MIEPAQAKVKPIVKVAAGSPATIEDARWALQARELEFASLGRIRSTAAKWAATLGSITGVFGIVTLAKGPDDISKVMGAWRIPFFGGHVDWKVLAGASIGLAIACAVLAIYLAATAAQESPTRFRFTGQEVRRLHREKTQNAANALRASKFLTLTAVALLSVGIAITWYATPEEPASGSNVLVVKTSGETSCGVMQASQPGMVEIVQADQQAPTTIPISDIRFLSTIAKCPGQK
jgi:hypothetical protein